VGVGERREGDKGIEEWKNRGDENVSSWRRREVGELCQWEGQIKGWKNDKGGEGDNDTKGKDKSKR
jgi:hypothetical protein